MTREAPLAEEDLVLRCEQLAECPGVLVEPGVEAFELWRRRAADVMVRVRVRVRVRVSISILTLTLTLTCRRSASGSGTPLCSRR